MDRKKKTMDFDFAPCRAGKSKPKPPTIEKVEPPSQSDFMRKREHGVDVKFAVPKEDNTTDDNTKNWVPLKHHGLQSGFSSKYLKGMMTNTNSSIDINMSLECYVNSLCRGESSKNSETKDSSKRQKPITTVDNRSFPNDLIMEILSRLPAKSIAKFRCVSKPWHSILSETYFTELFHTKSLACPRLLFCIPQDGNLFFFSTPQGGNPDENSFLVSAYRPISFPFFRTWERLCGPVCGLFSLNHIENMKSDGSKETVVVIVNTSTGQSLRLPGVDTGKDFVRCMVGYDPIDKQFKVLCMTRMVSDLGCFGEYRVLTLGTQNLEWRMIECSQLHMYFQVLSDEICIDGRLYYVGYVSFRRFEIVCFDLRSEKFRVIEKGRNYPGRKMRLVDSPILVNYKGKLGVLLSNKPSKVIADCHNIALWVLEDAERDEWSRRLAIFPPVWGKRVRGYSLSLVGVTDTDEIVLAPELLYLPFFVFYYYMKTKTIRKVEIKGMEKFKNCHVRTYLHHVENVRLMQ